MAINHKNLARSSGEYTRTYEDIIGVDFSDPTGRKNARRLPYMENMYKDYSGGGDYIIESVPGFRSIFSLGSRINSLFYHKVSDEEEYVIAHAGTGLYRFSVAERDSGISLTPIATVGNTRSGGVCYGGAFYIFDGTSVVRVSSDGTASRVGDAEACAPYIPLRYKNGKEFEQHNLLSDKFKEMLVIDDYSDLTYGTKQLMYSINDDGETCSVIKCADGIAGLVYVPSRVKIGERTYEVTAIDDLAFKDNALINGIYTNKGLKSIGGGAFSGCVNLKTAVISDTVSVIGDEAFSGCKALEACYLGTGLTSIGNNAFAECSMLKSINYASAQSAFTKIEGSESITAQINYGSRYLALTLTLPVKTPAIGIESVTLDGKEYAFFENVENGRVVSVNLDISDRSECLGSTVMMIGYEDPSVLGTGDYGSDVREGMSTSLFTDGAAIKKCTKAALFDGRIFLSGNPDFPNTVFFCAKDNPLYFGSLDYFNDGNGGYSVAELLPAQDNLIVLKSGDDGNGSIFYHKKEELKTAIRPVRYPTSFANSAIPALGGAAVFYDDPVFISRLGLCGLEKSSLGGVKAECRSHNVNPRLLGEESEKIRLAEWMGYLVLAANGRMYLADSRRTFNHESGAREYEWFFLNRIGVPLTRKRGFRFHSFPYLTLKKHENEDCDIGSESILTINTGGDIPPQYTYATIIDGVYYHVYRSEELTYTGISPCCEVLSVGELLFFGCENGAICVFNNDKRTVPSERILKNDMLTNAEKYAKTHEPGIHPDFYSFDGYSPRYVVKTGMDCCDIPYLEKNTTPGSLTVKFKSFTGSRMHLGTETDKQAYEGGGFCAGGLCFDTLSFGNLSFDGTNAPTAVCYDAPGRWIEKEIALSSDGFKSPIGIYSVTYRFKINGRIKKR